MLTTELRYINLKELQQDSRYTNQRELARRPRPLARKAILLLKLNRKKVLIKAIIF